MPAAFPTQTVRLRLIALPTEHGGWAFLIAPILTGLWISPTVAGGWLSLAALGAFLTRQPLKLALGDWRRSKRYPRTVWAERFACLYAILSLLAASIALWVTDHAFWLPLLLATPLLLVQLLADLRRQSRTLIAELAGATALQAIAAALLLTGGQPLGSALGLWGILSLWALTSIVYVRTRLRLARGQAARRLPVYLVHISACVLVIGGAWLGLISWLVAAAPGLLAIRAWIGLHSLYTPTPIIGVQEIVVALLTVVLVAMGWMP